jgi:hypothetical protein
VAEKAGLNPAALYLLAPGNASASEVRLHCLAALLTMASVSSLGLHPECICHCLEILCLPLRHAPAIHPH